MITFKRWLALLLAIVLVGSNAVYSMSSSLKANSQEGTEAQTETDGSETELKEETVSQADIVIDSGGTEGVGVEILNDTPPETAAPQEQGNEAAVPEDAPAETPSAEVTPPAVTHKIVVNKPAVDGGVIKVWTTGDKTDVTYNEENKYTQEIAEATPFYMEVTAKEAYEVDYVTDQNQKAIEPKSVHEKVYTYELLDAAESKEWNVLYKEAEINKESKAEDAKEQTPSAAEAAPGIQSMTSSEPEAAQATGRLTFDLSGASGTAPEKITSELGKSVSLPKCSADRENHTFVGWSTNKNAATAGSGNFSSKVYSAGASYKVEKTETLYAIWAPNNSCADFYIRLDGEIPDEPGTFSPSEYTAKVAHKENAVKNGYFVSDPTGTTVLNNLKSGILPSDQEIEKALKDKGKTFDPDTQYVIWYVIKLEGSHEHNAYNVDGVILEKEKINLYYHQNIPNVNGANLTGTFPTGQQYRKGESVSVHNGEGFSLSGYTFAGWNTKADGSGTPYAAGDSFTLEQETSLYAQWKPNSETEYAVEYYYQNEDGKYPKEANVRKELKGPTGTVVSTTAKTINGYTYDAEHENNLTEGMILADGSLTLKLYYKIHKAKASVWFYRDPSVEDDYAYMITKDDRLEKTGENKYEKNVTINSIHAFSQKKLEEYTIKAGELTEEPDEYKDCNIYVISKDAQGNYPNEWPQPVDSLDNYPLKDGDEIRYHVELKRVITPAKINYKATAGGSVTNSEEVIADSYVGSAAGSTASEAAGYKFLKWTDESGDTVSTDKTFVPQKDDATQCYKDMTYTAHFSEGEYTVTYEKGTAADGNPPEDAKKYAYKEDVTVLDNIGDLVGNKGDNDKSKFLCWTTEKSNINAGKLTLYYPGESFEIKRDMVFYPVFYENGKLKIYDISFEIPDGSPGTLSRESAYEILENSKFAQVVQSAGHVPMAVLPSGYTFEGWKLKDGDGTVYKTAEELLKKFGADTVTKNYVFEAQVKANAVKLLFEENGGTKVEDISGATDQGIKNKEMPKTTYEGYLFKGWFDNEALTGSAATKLPEKFPAENQTYYAKWERDSSEFKVDGITKVYDGGSYSVTFSGELLANETVQYSLDGTTYQSGKLFFKNVNVNAENTNGSKVYTRVMNGEKEIWSGSALVRITKRPVTLAADDLSKTYGDIDPQLTAKIITENGLVGSDSLNYKVTREANKETVGSYPIQVVLGENTNYDITAADGTFTINPRPITLKAKDSSKIYGTSDPEMTAQITAGTVIGEDALDYTVGRVAGEDAGSYDMNVTLGSNPNYLVTAEPGIFTIHPKEVNVIIQANEAQKVYGSKDPVLTADVTGTVDEDKLNFTVSREEGEAAGEYAISITLGDNPNYKVAVSGGTFTIMPKPIEIKANDGKKIYGDEGDEGLTAAVQTDSLVGTDELSYTLQRSSGNTIGEYEIKVIPANGENPNYLITATPGIFTIEPKPITVKADDRTKVYGIPADPAYSAQVTTQNGLVGADSLSYAFERAAGEDVGTYSIDIHVKEDDISKNYLITKEEGTLNITQALARVAAEEHSKLYGENDPRLTAAEEGVIEGDTLNYVLERAASEEVGKHEIHVTVGNNPNYMVVPDHASFTIYGQVFYDNNGGNGEAVDAGKYELYESVNVMDQGTVSRDGASFLGWSKKQQDISRPEEAEIVEELTMGASSITLYAVWAAEAANEGGTPGGGDVTAGTTPTPGAAATPGTPAAANPITPLTVLQTITEPIAGVAEAVGEVLNAAVEPLVQSDDEAVPLANRNSKDHKCCILHLLLILLALLLEIGYTKSVKKRQERIFRLREELAMLEKGSKENDVDNNVA